jgi:hypothetical protein
MQLAERIVSDLSAQRGSVSIETTRRAKAFVDYAKLLATTKGDGRTALQMAAARKMGPEVTAGIRLQASGGPRAVKAAIEAGSTTDTTWAAPLAEYGRAASAFLETLRSVSAFERLLPDMRQVPLHVRTGVVTAGATGSIVEENKPTPISSLTLEGGTLPEQKAVTIVAATTELVKLSGGPGADLFERELRGAVGTTVDRKFVDLITDGLTAADSSGPAATDISNDITVAYQAVETGAQSRLFWLLDSDTAKALTAKATTAGDAAFPQMTPQGGILRGVPAIVTDCAKNQIVLVDANGIAAGSDTIEIDSATHATVQMDSTPDNPASASTVMKSLWQHDMVGIRAVRFFGAQRLRANSVYVISGSTSGWW